MKSRHAEDSAVSMLTFHQAKGLEFDHVYVAITGRKSIQPPRSPTRLFAARHAKYKVEDGRPVSKDPGILRLSEADREREVYVAITRGKDPTNHLARTRPGPALGDDT